VAVHVGHAFDTVVVKLGAMETAGAGILKRRRPVSDTVWKRHVVTVASVTVENNLEHAVAEGFVTSAGSNG
jgi:hypothetical protein